MQRKIQVSLPSSPGDTKSSPSSALTSCKCDRNVENAIAGNTSLPPSPSSLPPFSALQTLLCFATSTSASNTNALTRTPKWPNSARTRERYSARVAAAGFVLSMTQERGGEAAREVRRSLRQARRVFRVSWFCGGGSEGGGVREERGGGEGGCGRGTCDVDVVGGPKVLLVEGGFSGGGIADKEDLWGRGFSSGRVEGAAAKGEGHSRRREGR